MYQGEFVVWRVEGIVTFASEVPNTKPMSMDVLGVRHGMPFAAEQARIRWSRLPALDRCAVRFEGVEPGGARANGPRVGLSLRGRLPVSHRVQEASGPGPRMGVLMRRLWWSFKYARLTVKHKWFVFLAGLKMCVPIHRLIVHDLSKFGRSELLAYGRQFFGDKGDPDGFARAWLHHQNVNPHHWEYWISRSGHNRGKQAGKHHKPFVLPMPDTYVREMIADWMGASRAYTGSWEMTDWLVENLPRMWLHQYTRARLQDLLPLETATRVWDC